MNYTNEFLSHIQCDVDQYTKVRGRSRRKSKSFKSESEEYDTLGSDSDTEVGTSSRTESSNHLDDSGPTAMMARSPGPNSGAHRGREQRLALVPRAIHHSKLVFGLLCWASNSKYFTNQTRYIRINIQMCCTTRKNQVHQQSRHQFLNVRLFPDWKSRGRLHASGSLAIPSLT